MLFVFMLCLGLLTHSLFISCINLHHGQCFYSVGVLDGFLGYNVSTIQGSFYASFLNCGRGKGLVTSR